VQRAFNEGTPFLHVVSLTRALKSRRHCRRSRRADRSTALKSFFTDRRAPSIKEEQSVNAARFVILTIPVSQNRRLDDQNSSSTSRIGGSSRALSARQSLRASEYDRRSYDPRILLAFFHQDRHSGHPSALLPIELSSGQAWPMDPGVISSAKRSILSIGRSILLSSFPGDPLRLLGPGGCTRRELPSGCYCAGTSRPSNHGVS